MFSACGDYFVCMKRNKLVRSHQHRMDRDTSGDTVGTFLLHTAIVNQVWEWIITWLALKKVQHIFWSLFSIAFISRNSVSFSFAHVQDLPPAGNKESLFFFNSSQMSLLWMRYCHCESILCWYSQYIHTFLCICHSSSSLEVASFLSALHQKLIECHL